MTRAEERQIDDAIKGLAQGHARDAMRMLCRLRRIPELDVGLPVRASNAVPPGVTIVRGANDSRSALDCRPQKKPAKRIVDPAAIEAYRAAHPLCEVCGLKPGEIHHIKKRGLHGDDVAENLLALCGGAVGHHTGNVGWHTLGARAWFKRFNMRLSAEAVSKIIKAMGW